MKLTYRGVSYEDNPYHPEMTKSLVLGKYRGQAWNIRYPRHMNIAQPVMELKYRGVSYRTTSTGDIQPVNTSTPALGHIAQPQLSEVAKIHHSYLLQRLQHRIAVAKAQGNANLVYLLEEESRQLA
ncbi:MAG: DUF4278 domain-containing protein [Geitlerinemataceae cyanobacterium]